jgi:hypothetical protein
MKEEAVTFGTTNLLVGVFTEPDAPVQTKTRWAVILLNAGLLHRVGPYRLYVDLARKLSSIGFGTLRFDLSGVGDSLQGDDSRLYDERVLDNVRQAMDLLNSRRGFCKFVLMGLCAGADNAHKIAVRDERVAAAVYFDGYGYRTCGYYFQRYGPKMFSLSKWKSFLKRSIVSVIDKRRGESEKKNRRWEIFARKFPPKEQVEKEIQGLVDRGVNLLYVYSGGVKDQYFNHCGQFNAMFRSINFRGRVEAVYFDKAEHTYPSIEDRHNLMSTVCQWMSEHYGGT